MVFYISLIGFFGIFTTTISKNPVLPYLVKSLGADAQVLGITSSISPFAGIVFSFPVGVLADKLGKKLLLIISAFVFLLAPLMYLLVENAWYLIPVRFFHGMATAILGPIASTIIAEAYDRNKGEKLGVYSSTTLIGRTLAPLAGGAIIALFSSKGELFSYRAVYFIAFLFSIPVVIGAFMVKTGEAALKKSLGLAAFFESLVYIIRNKVILATALVDLSTYFSFGIFETFAPGYLKTLGYKPQTVGLIFSLQILSIALTKPLFGKIADIIDKRSQIACGLFTLGFAVAALPFVTSFAAVLGISLLFGLAMSFSTVATSAYVADVAKKDQLGASMGALSSIMDVGHSTGPLIAGSIIAAFSISAGFISGFILAAAITVMFLFIAYRK
ncbi:MAG: MFS transporter [Candidatus Firestonebacteria bacterium]